MTSHSLGQALFNLKRYDDAANAVQECMRLDPNYAGCVMLWANVLQKLGKESEAKQAYEQALKLRKEHPQPVPTARTHPQPTAQ